MFILFLINFFLSSSYLKNEPVPTSVIRVNVVNINSKKGDILLALYNSDKGFPGKKDGVIKTAKGTPQNGKCSIVITDVTPGTYAIALFHDTNGDGKLNTNFLGIPKEGYGFSNNARNTFSAPSFRQASFEHKTESIQEIKVHY